MRCGWSYSLLSDCRNCVVQLGYTLSGGTRMNDSIDSGMDPLDACGIRKKMRVKLFLEIASAIVLCVLDLCDEEMPVEEGRR